MQTQKRKKKLKNKKDSQIIQPIKHPKFGNLNNYSEDIIKEIIDKLISLSITEVIRTKIDSKISDFCFETIKRYLNLTVSLTNISHDRDNLYDIENYWEEQNRPNSDEKRYKMKNHKKCKKIRNKKAENDLFELTDINRDFEAEMILKDKDIDDYLNKSIVFEGIVDKKRISKANYWGDIPQPKTYGPLRIASKSNAVIKDINLNKDDYNNKIPSNNIKPEINTQKKKSTILLKSRRQSKSPLVDEITLGKSEAKKLFEIRQRKFLLLDMEEMKDIEEKKTRKEESDEIKELRKLKLEELQLLKEEEEKTKYAHNFISQNISNFEYDLDSLNLTAMERARNVQAQKKFVEDQIRKGNFTYDFNNKMILIRHLKPEALLEDFPMAITKPKDKGNLSKINTIKKKSDDLSKDKDILNDQLKKKNIVEEKNYVSNYFNYNFNFNMKIAPCGSNFEKIRPAVGVNIYEGDEIKTGGREFFEKFKKFSIKDYNKMLKEISEQQKALNKSLQEKSKEEENKNLDNLIINKNGMNSSVDISKIKKNFGYLNKRTKFNASKNKKFMSKSQSQIFTIDKNNLYNNLIIHDETKEINYYKKNDKDFTDKLNQNNLFLKRLKNIIKLKKSESASFQLIDSFNKNIIIRGENNGIGTKRGWDKEIEKEKKDNKLPIIPPKTNRSVIFTRKEQFLRTRMKKLIEGLK